ncbi:phosphoenolpyruvate--protein phosphotransferase [Cylindrospermopsis raciborskii]|uniref:phosphoenolpyruvate--protein phosphotransferase n=1 Tax=Cylindrospermopsis raciborskii TaxID=77022 RepID=UPI000778EC3F|nr:phosphoenolpyruvate--protein phosphotransferase [Cylindrospermopsis raciborskii]MCZ2201129.1 phosphoenolpyruvate--protein phosphotransferase [Cylindrospermopsis raciborskii PAMP2012]MCZ2204755.1 phosphoenolpyruvate--protein phosphotransferase [Cylindrospermopsis raciborskii PAMP2011]
MTVVGIVIVSHSKQLALGVQELAAQMVKGKISLAVAAGVDDPTNPLGTDPIQVYQAISSVFSEDGVIVLMDLGSALMSAEMALEFLLPAQRDKIYLCDAPLVEGAIAATVAASTGKNIQEVLGEAQGSLLAKSHQLNLIAHPLHNDSNNIDDTVPTKELLIQIKNRLGLHARPAAQFVATACRFEAKIQVQNLTRNTEAVRGDSINQVGTLGVRQGHELLITARGKDAQEAITALQSLIIHNFGEQDPILELPTRTISPLPDNPGQFTGIAASPGIAIAPVVHYQLAPVSITEYHIENVEIEWQRLQHAIQRAKQEITMLLSHASVQIGDAEAAIFDAHLLFLADPVMLDGVRRYIIEEKLNAEAAWQAVVEEVTNSYRQLEDAYLKERVDDVVDVGRRVLRILLGNLPTELHISEPSIVVGTDLTPSDTARLDPRKVLGICMTAGSATSHSAIIARTLGIPAVVGVDSQVLTVENGTVIALDGEGGKVWIEPEGSVLTALENKRQVWQTNQAEARKKAHQPATTRDGQRIHVFANIGSVADAKAAVGYGAEGVGLLRTEFLYLEQIKPPTEEEQLQVYQDIAQILGERPLIIRTLDVGGDKQIPYLGSTLKETNPFLGVRGIRFCLEHPYLLKTQLRAILRASANHHIKVMWPMISTLTELRAAKSILNQSMAELAKDGIEFDAKLPVGVMIETPAAVAIADHLAKEVDFFSIGTNDLSQYVMACDRTNPKVANLTDALQPAVLRMIQKTVEAAHAANIWVGLCGEIAAETVVAPILIGLGIDELSTNPQAIAPLKQVISQLTTTESQVLARVALNQDSASRVRELVYPIG